MWMVAGVLAGPVAGANVSATVVDLTEEHRLRVEVSRTTVMEYQAWVAQGRGVSREGAAMDAALAGDGIPNLWKFALEVPNPSSRVRGDRVTPHPVRVERGGRIYYGLEFTRARAPMGNRVVYALERFEGDEWANVVDPVVVAEADAGGGLERVVFSDGVARAGAGSPPDFRLVVQLEPPPTFFAHYMSDLNPGWRAMAFLTQPAPAYFRLFHDRPARMQPIPSGPEDHFRSTGGVHRDLPFMPPGFSYESGRESARLEIRRAQRAGVDGFAVNCLSGETAYLEALFEAAEELHRREGGKPFQITLSLDINVLPHKEHRLLVTLADLIRTWLQLGEKRGRAPHLARRGGLPLVMGYQSHWIWIDYLHRLFEIWEWEQGLRETFPWTAELGPRPDSPSVPEGVVALYGQVRKEEARRLQEAGDPEAERKAAQTARDRAVRAWAKEAEAWPLIRVAYRHLEQMVGQEMFWQFDAVDMESMADDLEGIMRVVAKDFPAVNMFLPRRRLTDLARQVVREEGAEWGEPIYYQYVAYGQNEQDGYFAGNFHETGGTETLRGGWYRAIGSNLETREPVTAGRSSLIQYTTWNDFNEHSHIAPSLQLRYAMLDLTRHFISHWKTGMPPAEPREQVFLFYRKYPKSSSGRSFPFRYLGDYAPSRFEIITFLEEEGTVELLGEKRGAGFGRAEQRRVKPGLSVTSFSGEDENLWREGKVSAEVRTTSGRKLVAAGWEEITHRPFRQDSTMAGASSRCDRLWAADMPARNMGDFRFSEYGDADGDGLPNWFEMLYFGRGWLHLQDQTAARPDADENRDGRTNLEHFHAGTNPIFHESPYPYTRDSRGVPIPLRVDPSRRTTLQAEHFDRGGLGVAYQKAALQSMGVGDYRDSRYDLVPHRRVESHEEDGGSWILTDLGNGDWFSYTLEIQPGCYEISARVRQHGGRMVVELDGVPLATGEVRESSFWSTQRIGRIQVPPGPPVRSLRLRFEDPGFALNWIRFERCRR
jgi:hypothetical protein